MLSSVCLVLETGINAHWHKDVDGIVNTAARC